MYALAVALLYLIVFVFGSVIGSFLNVVVYRLPLGISIAKGRSFCTSCKTTIAPYDMIPVFSWLLLRGKCRCCGAAISPRYPLVELAGGLLAVLVYWQLGFTPMALLAFAVGAVLLALSLIDWDTMTIPNGLVLALAGLAAAACWLWPGIFLGSRFIGMVCVSLPMLLLTLLIPGAFGGGDIKLMAACGFLLGWQQTLVAGFLGILLGGIYAVVLLCKNRQNRKAHFPFGPFLAVGIFSALLWGNQIINWYWRLFS